MREVSPRRGHRGHHFSSTLPVGSGWDMGCDHWDLGGDTGRAVPVSEHLTSPPDHSAVLARGQIPAKTRSLPPQMLIEIQAVSGEVERWSHFPELVRM